MQFMSHSLTLDAAPTAAGRAATGRRPGGDYSAAVATADSPLTTDILGTT